MYEISELKQLLKSFGTEKEKKEIVYLRDLIKASSGRKDISKLSKRVIVNKLGHTQTVYVQTHEEKKEKKKRSIWDFLTGWFGVKDESAVRETLNNDYGKYEIKQKFDIDNSTWIKHCLEYFQNKEKWDKFFSGKKKITTGGGVKGKEKGKITGGGEKKKSSWNKSVMKFLFEQYGKKKETPVSAIDQMKNLLTSDNKKKSVTKKGLNEKVSDTTEKVKTKTIKQEHYQEAGKHVWGSRADLADLLRAYKDDTTKTVNLSDIEALEETGEAGYIVTRERQFGGKKAVVEMMKAAGANSSATYIVWRLISSILKQPADDMESRKKYVIAIERMLKTFTNWKTVPDAQEGIDIIREEMEGLQFSEQEKEQVEKYEKLAGENHSDWSKIWRDDYMRRYSAKRASDLFWKDDRVILLRKEYDKNRSRASEIRQLVQDRTLADPNCLLNLYKTLGGDFFMLLDKPYSFQDSWPISHVSKKSEQKFNSMMKNAHLNSNWEWFKEASGDDSEKEKQRIKSLKILKWEREVPDEVERIGGVGQVDFPSADSLLKAFNLTNVQFGNWVDTLDRRTHVQRAGEALSDMSYLFNIDKKFIGLNGRLAMAFGARGSGNASAHYEPSNKIINITKERGGGSLAHEWGHSLDNLLSMLSYSEDGKGGRNLSYASEQQYKPDGTFLHEDVKAALEKVNNAINEGSFHPSSTFTVSEKATARKHFSDNNRFNQLFNKFVTGDKTTTNAAVDWQQVTEEQMTNFLNDLARQEAEEQKENDRRMVANGYNIKKSSQGWINKQKDGLTRFKKSFMFKYFVSKYYLGDSFHDEDAKPKNRHNLTLTMPSIMPDELVTAGKSNYAETSEKMGKYWSRPREMFARAFEAYVSDKLDEKKMKNSYLVSGVTESDVEKYANVAKILEGQGGKTSIYPRGEERKNIKIAMDELMGAISKHGVLQKAVLMLEKQDLLKSRFAGHNFFQGIFVKD